MTFTPGNRRNPRCLIPIPGKGEGPDVFFWKGWFWMVKDLWRGLGVYRFA